MCMHVCICMHMHVHVHMCSWRPGVRTGAAGRAARLERAPLELMRAQCDGENYVGGRAWLAVAPVYGAPHDSGPRPLLAVFGPASGSVWTVRAAVWIDCKIIIILYEFTGCLLQAVRGKRVPQSEESNFGAKSAKSAQK